MSVVLATLCLNEMEHLPYLYEQHKNWPDISAWIFVESADHVYAQCNPSMVENGLSVDGTSEFLREISKQDERVIYIPHGISRSPNLAQGKCEARSRYLQAAEKYRPRWLYVVDADEFYTFSDQSEINRKMSRCLPKWTAFCFKQRQVWRPPSISHEPMFQYEVSGSFWDIPHCRGWRYFPGSRYSKNHNTPERSDGLDLGSNMVRYDRMSDGFPQCVHLGWTSKLESRAAKNRYYAERGESRDPKRSWYVGCRAAYETWNPGDELPRGGRITPYSGPIPEVFLRDNSVKKPVDNPNFWARRIELVSKSGEEYHKAIYDIDISVWKDIQGYTKAILSQHLSPGDSLLDAGCGCGYLFACTDLSVQYVGIDISPDLISKAKSFYPQGDFRLGNLSDMAQFQDKQFSVAVCRSMKKMIVDNLGTAEWDKIERELRRVSQKLILLEYETLPYQYEVLS